MAETFKRFEPTASDAEEVKDEVAVTFEIGDEKFTCIPNSKIPAGALRRLSTDAWTVTHTCNFIEGILVDKDNPKDSTPTQIERFRRTLERKDVVVDGELLSDIVVWLIGAVTARPTKSPSGSAGGAKNTKTGSKAKRGGKVAPLTNSA